MIGAPELIARARAAPVLAGGNPVVAIDRFMRSLPGVKPKMSSDAARLTYPSALACEPLRAWLAGICSDQGSTVLAALLETLRRPLRAYPVDAPSAKTFLLLSSFDNGLVVSCLVNVGAPHVIVDLRLFNSSPRSEIAADLEELVPRIHSAVRYGDLQRSDERLLLFVADPGRMAGSAGPRWRSAAQNVAEAWGYDVEFDVNPIRDDSATMRHMDVFGGAAVIVVPTAAGSFSVADKRHPRWRHRTAELDRADLEPLLEDFRLTFELGLIDPPMVTTWDQFRERADELEGVYCKLSSACKNGVKGNAYYDPGRMWQFASKLSEAARRYYLLGWTINGRLEAWVQDEVGIEIALTDSQLGDTDFNYDGRTLSWEPHVKVDDAKDDITRCGRIYFAIDDVGTRFVIHYVGIHR
jgi:hypothetical protein